MRSTANKEKPDVILSQNKRSVDAQKGDTKRTFVESEYVKNPENTYNEKIGHERQKMIDKAEILMISALDRQSSKRRSDKFRLIGDKMKRVQQQNSIEVDKATLTSDENNYASKEFKSTMH